MMNRFEIPEDTYILSIDIYVFDGVLIQEQSILFCKKWIEIKKN